jgi:5-formyltetrahydrofolate cyclo-ligase
MLHELDPESMEHSERPPAISAAENWDEVRLWRKAKRTVLIERRVAMSATERAARSEAIGAALTRAFPFHPGMRGEYDSRRLVRCLHAKGARLALPVVVEKAKPLVFREWWPGISMTKGIWNIPVPAGGDPVAPDLLRLGYGGGYYDRTLAALAAKPKMIGIGFELSQIATIYPQPHDIAMDLIVTEARAG